MSFKLPETIECWTSLHPARLTPEGFYICDRRHGMGDYYPLPGDDDYEGDEG